MGSPGLKAATDKMREAGIDATAIEVFAHYYRQLEHGETGMIPESAIDPLDMDALDDVDVDPDAAAEALRHTAVIKLNGGLGTSMGMDRAKSLLCVRRGLSFLDIIARQVLHLRKQYDAPLPLMFMNSFRTSADTMAALARYEDLPVEGLPLEFFHDDRPEYLQTHRTHQLLARALRDHGADWVVPLDADEFLQDEGGPLLVDCVTLWLTRVMDEACCWDDDGWRDGGEVRLREETARLVEALRGTTREVVLVTNEVGQGVVPASASGRRFRDEMGLLNSALAAVCEDVLLCVAGRTLTLSES